MKGLACVGFVAALGLGGAACSNGGQTPDTGTGVDAAIDAPGDAAAVACGDGGLAIMPPATTTCYRAASCSGDPFCPNIYQNNPASPTFLLQQIDISTPSTLAQGSNVGPLLAMAVASGKFSWGISLDFSTNTLTTGTLQQGVTAQIGTGLFAAAFSYVNGTAPATDAGSSDPNRWNAVSATFTMTGQTFTTGIVPLITIPVYSATGNTLMAELPLRNDVMHDVVLEAGNNCIGLARSPFNSCLQHSWATQTPGTDGGVVSSGVLEGDVTVADAMNIPIMGAGTLCDVIAGVMDCTMTPMAQWPHQPDSTTTSMAWHLIANFAAVAAQIN